MLDKDFNKVYESFNQNHNRLRQRLVASLPDSIKQHKRAGRISHALAFTGGTIMRSRITKLAVATVIVVVVLIGMHYFGGGSVDMTSVAWGNVLEYVEQVSTVVFRITVINTVPGKDEPVEVQAVVYVSSEYGTRRDMYMDNKIVSTSHTVPKENIVITVIPEEKKFFRMIIPQDKFRQRQTNEDPREMIKQFISTEYEQLSPDQINGIDVEGIEVKGPSVMGGMFENATARLWVDVQTDLPVLMEIEGVAGGGSIQMKMVIDDFQWDVELEPSLFEPNIPADYTSKKIDIPDVNEGAAIRGLQLFAELTDGRYPSSLAMMTLMKEISETLKTKHGDKPTKEIKEEKLSTLQSILPTGALYAQLARENKDVAYYGDTVTAKDSEKVLMRWKISDDEYRVILGDLTTKNLSAEELAELEKVQ